MKAATSEGIMSRPLRIQYPDAWYHVMNRGRRGEKAESVRTYKQFVSKETLEEINQIFGRRNLPTIIGRKGFVDSHPNLNTNPIS